MSTSLLPLVAFVVVVAMIPLALRALKRAGVGGAAAGGVLKSVAHLGLGTTQRVSVVEITVGAERQWLVLGVTGEQVTHLASYDAPPAAAVSAPPAMPAHTVTVQQLIARWRGASGGTSSGASDGAAK